MPDIGQEFLSASILVALIIFLLRELITEVREARRKKSRLQAAKNAIIREMRENRRTYNSILSALILAKDSLEISGIFKLVTKPSGRTEHKSFYDDGSFRGGGLLLNVERKNSDRVMLDIYEMSKTLAKNLEVYQDALDGLEHLRRGLFDYSEPGTFEEGFFEGFIEWAMRELNQLRQELMESSIAFGEPEEQRPLLDSPPLPVDEN